MKTSNLLLLTFAGLLFCILSVVHDLNDRGQSISIQELPTAAKACFHKYFPNKEISRTAIKEEIIKTTYEMGKNNHFNQDFYNDDVLACLEY